MNNGHLSPAHRATVQENMQLRAQLNLAHRLIWILTKRHGEQIITNEEMEATEKHNCLLEHRPVMDGDNNELVGRTYKAIDPQPQKTAAEQPVRRDPATGAILIN